MPLTAPTGWHTLDQEFSFTSSPNRCFIHTSNNGEYEIRKLPNGQVWVREGEQYRRLNMLEDRIGAVEVVAGFRAMRLERAQQLTYEDVDYFLACRAFEIIEVSEDILMYRIPDGNTVTLLLNGGGYRITEITNVVVGVIQSPQNTTNTILQENCIRCGSEFPIQSENYSVPLCENCRRDGYIYTTCHHCGRPTYVLESEYNNHIGKCELCAPLNLEAGSRICQRCSAIFFSSSRRFICNSCCDEFQPAYNLSDPDRVRRESAASSCAIHDHSIDAFAYTTYNIHTHTHSIPNRNAFDHVEELRKLISRLIEDRSSVQIITINNILQTILGIFPDPGITSYEGRMEMLKKVKKLMSDHIELIDIEIKSLTPPEVEQEEEEREAERVLEL